VATVVQSLRSLQVKPKDNQLFNPAYSDNP
jgi:hypothetical protein